MENFTIELVKDYPTSSRSSLENEERQVIQTIREEQSLNVIGNKNAKVRHRKEYCSEEELLHKPIKNITHLDISKLIEFKAKRVAENHNVSYEETLHKMIVRMKKRSLSQNIAMFVSKLE